MRQSFVPICYKKPMTSCKRSWKRNWKKEHMLSLQHLSSKTGNSSIKIFTEPHMAHYIYIKGDIRSWEESDIDVVSQRWDILEKTKPARKIEVKGYLLTCYNLNMEQRIVVNPKIMVWKPIIKGTRVTVEHILKLVRQGMTINDILEDYPHLTKTDIEAAIDYASKSLQKEGVYPLKYFAWSSLQMKI